MKAQKTGIQRVSSRSSPGGDGRENNSVLIVDFGSQVTRLIARRVRENGVYCEIAPFPRAAEALTRLRPRAVILSGGPASAVEACAPRVAEEVFAAGLPVLGICYGLQVMCVQLGGSVRPAAREFGRARVEVTADCPLFAGLARSLEGLTPSVEGLTPSVAGGTGGKQSGAALQVWMSHGDHVARLPDGFHAVAVSEGAPYAAIADETRRFYGVQFHPEVAHTPQGGGLLRNFTHDIAGCSGGWTMAAFRQAAVSAARAQAEGGRVICGLSGGVDSSVTAVLLHEALGERLVCVFVDTGLLRAGEAEEVVRMFRGHYNITLRHVEAADLFLERLAGVIDPEAKRKAIGAAFIEVFEAEAQAAGGAEFLAQGTLYPDVIESLPAAPGVGQTIKSHHNVGGLPQRMGLRLMEPLRELFKDEVRVLGRELGMPERFVGRHPFPGPGLAVRLPGEVTAERLATLRAADAIYIEEIRSAGLYDEIWQAFAVLMPVRTVGVMGDGRTYDWVCALRAVTSTDGMTAESYGFSHEFLARVATRIVNETPGISRVVYDVSSKPPATIEWE